MFSKGKEHCSTLRLMEERIVHPVKYNDEGKPTAAEFEYPKIYHNDAMAMEDYKFLNSSHVATVCIVRKAKPQFTMSSAEEIYDHLTNITKNGAKDDKIAPEIVKDPGPECSLIPGPRQVIQHKVESR
ncbi:hypothetical protein WN943_026054 [Citrus x changshan-huyou]